MSEFSETEFSAMLDSKLEPLYAAGGCANTLFIVVSRPLEDSARKILETLPGNTLAMWLYAPCGDAEASALRETLKDAPIIIEPFDCSASLRMKIGMALQRIEANDAKIMVENELEDSIDSQMKWLKDALSDTFNGMGNLSRSIHVRTRCAIANLPLMTNLSVSVSASAIEGGSAIVCGAGPSLASQLHLLKSLPESVILLAAGRAAQTLADSGIKPHFIVETDSFAHLNWKEGFRPDATLVAPECLSPSVAARFKSIVWHDSRTSYLSSLFERLGLDLPKLSVSGSVVLSAIDFAASCGIMRIALIGCDLALSPSGDSHIGGGDFKGSLGEDTVEVEGIDGATLRTTASFLETKRALEAHIEGLAGSASSLRIFNCGSAGASIEGTERMSLEAFLELSAGMHPLPPLTKLRSSALLPLNWLKEVCVSAEESIRTLASIDECLKKIIRSGTASPRLREDMRRLSGTERSLRVAGSASPLSLCAAATIPSLLPKKFARQRQGDNEGIRMRCRIHAELLEELLADMKEAAAAVGEARLPSINPYAHHAFRKAAVRWLSAESKELASFISKSPLGVKPEGFEIRPKGQHIPIVLSVPASNGESVPISSLASFTRESLSVARYLLESQSFNPDSCAVIFLAHVNWGGIIDAATRIPSIKCAVVEPYPELLSYMSDTSSFLNALPGESLVVCADPRLKQWESLLRRRLKIWRDSGLKPVLLCNPATEGIPAILALKGRIASVLNG